MSTLLDVLKNAKQVGTEVDSQQLLTGCRIEAVTKDGYEMLFCKGTDVKTTLAVSILVAEAKFTTADYASVVNPQKNAKGKRGDEAVKLTKKDFDFLVANPVAGGII